MRHKSRWSQVQSGAESMQKAVKRVLSENRKMSLLREIVGPLVPTECQAMDQSHESKLFKLIEKDFGWIQEVLGFCGINTSRREGTKELRVFLKV